jgi:nicotinate-nucleotide adenylyltransferase
MRLGIFGGSFDPVHVGHLTLANCCLQQAALDEVWFLPAAQQPLKPAGPQAPNHDRCRMIELAIAGHDAFRLSRLEIDRGGTSYTVDTLEQLHAERPDDELFLLMGADSLAELPTWHAAGRILEMATPLVVSRAGEPSPSYEPLRELLSPEQWEAIADCHVEMPAMNISSSEIRCRVGTGKSFDQLTPAAVATHITKHGLYAL